MMISPSTCHSGHSQWPPHLCPVLPGEASQRGAFPVLRPRLGLPCLGHRWPHRAAVGRRAGPQGAEVTAPGTGKSVGKCWEYQVFTGFSLGSWWFDTGFLMGVWWVYGLWWFYNVYNGLLEKAVKNTLGKLPVAHRETHTAIECYWKSTF